MSALKPIKLDKDLLYNTIELELTNPTASPVAFNVFNSNVLSSVPDTNGVNTFPNALSNQITVGSMNSAVTYAPSNNRIYSGNSTGLIQVINPSTLEIEATIQATSGAANLIYASGVDKIFGIDTSANVIHVIDVATNTLAFTITSVGAIFGDIVYSSINSQIYVTDTVAGTVQVYNAVTYTLVTTIALGGAPNYLGYSEITNEVYISEFAAGIEIINGSSNTITGSIGGFGIAAFQVYNSVDQEMYVFDGGLLSFVRVDVNTASIVGAPIGGFGADVVAGAYSPKDNIIYAADFFSGFIRLIDGTTKTIILSIPIPPFFLGQVIYASGIDQLYFATDGIAPFDYIQQLSGTNNQFFIGGSTNYDQFIQDTLINPKKVDRIRIDAGDIGQLSNTLGIKVEDASGLQVNYSKLPNVTIATNQFQGQIGQVNFDNLILFSGTSIDYIIPPLTTITWIVYYKEYKRADLLAGNINGYYEFDVEPPFDINKYDEVYLEKTRRKPTYEWYQNFESANFIKTKKIIEDSSNKLVEEMIKEL